MPVAKVLFLVLTEIIDTEILIVAFCPYVLSPEKDTLMSERFPSVPPLAGT